MEHKKYSHKYNIGIKIYNSNLKAKNLLNITKALPQTNVNHSVSN